jgi:hypothetical protein
MKNLEIQYILLAILGVFIHILMNILNRKNKSIPISFMYYITDVDNWIRMILVALSILALFLMSESLSDIFGLKLSDGSTARDVFAFLTGYLNHSFIKNVLKIFYK